MIIQGSFTDSNTGAFTLNNYQRVITEADKLHAFQNSITLSLVTALIGAVLGFFAAYGLFKLRSMLHERQMDETLTLSYTVVS